MKRIFEMVLIISIVAALMISISVPVTAATSGKCGDNLIWSLDDEGTLTISGIGDMDDFTSSYSTPWYIHGSSIKKVIIEEDVTSIGDSAFSYCRSLTSIAIPDGVTSIGSSAFSDCTNLTSITIPDSVTSISKEAFHDCSSLASITIPDSVTSIGEDAFSYCRSLTSIAIPDSVTSIGNSAFSNCASLASITIPDSVTSIGNSAFFDCIRLASITMPDSVTSIGLCVFYDCKSLTSITIPDGVTSIGSSAFYNCTNLTSITIPDSVTSIGDDAFHNCENLASITIPDSVTRIGSYAFSGCTSLRSITIPDDVTSIGNNAFSGCTSLRSITIPDSVTSIGNSTFFRCTSLRSITIPDSVTSIGNRAFYECTSLTSIKIPDGVTSIGGGMLYGCSKLESITLPFIGKEKRETTGTAESVFGIIFGSSGDNSGTEQKYKENETVNYDIPSSLKTVTITDESEFPYGAFSNCIHLTDIIIEGNPLVIYPEAFYGCTGLLNVTVKSKDVKYPTSNIFDKAEHVTLRGYKNSSTETYANRFSDRFYFEALDADNMEQILSGTADRINNKIVVSVEIDEAVSTKCLHIALYNSTNILLDYIIVPNNKPFDHTNVVFKDNKDASYAKVFLWSGIASLQPIAEAVKVEIK